MNPLTLTQKQDLCEFAYTQGPPFPNDWTAAQIDALGVLMGYPRPQDMPDDNYAPALARYIVRQHSTGTGRFA